MDPSQVAVPTEMRHEQREESSAFCAARRLGWAVDWWS